MIDMSSQHAMVLQLMITAAVATAVSRLIAHRCINSSHALWRRGGIVKAVRKISGPAARPGRSLRRPDGAA